MYDLGGVGKYNRVAIDRVAAARVLQVKAEPGGALVGVDLLALNTGLLRLRCGAVGDDGQGASEAYCRRGGMGTYAGGSRRLVGREKNRRRNGNAEGATDSPHVTMVNGHTININTSAWEHDDGQRD